MDVARVGEHDLVRCRARARCGSLAIPRVDVEQPSSNPGQKTTRRDLVRHEVEERFEQDGIAGGAARRTLRARTGCDRHGRTSSSRSAQADACAARWPAPELVFEHDVLVVLEVHDVRAAVPCDDRLRQLADVLAGRERVDEIRPSTVREQRHRPVPASAYDQDGERRRPDVVDRLRVVGDGDRREMSSRFERLREREHVEARCCPVKSQWLTKRMFMLERRSSWRLVSRTADIGEVRVVVRVVPRRTTAPQSSRSSCRSSGSTLGSGACRRARGTTDCGETMFRSPTERAWSERSTHATERCGIEVSRATELVAARRGDQGARPDTAETSREQESEPAYPSSAGFHPRIAGPNRRRTENEAGFLDPPVAVDDQRRYRARRPGSSCVEQQVCQPLRRLGHEALESSDRTKLGSRAPSEHRSEALLGRRRRPSYMTRSPCARRARRVDRASRRGRASRSTARPRPKRSAPRAARARRDGRAARSVGRRRRSLAFEVRRDGLRLQLVDALLLVSVEGDAPGYPAPSVQDLGDVSDTAVRSETRSMNSKSWTLSNAGSKPPTAEASSSGARRAGARRT